MFYSHPNTTKIQVFFPLGEKKYYIIYRYAIKELKLYQDVSF